MALFGLYGIHTVSQCPLVSKENAKILANVEKATHHALPQYKIHKIIGKYHSSLEHTFLWILDAEDPHLLQKFALDTGVANFNKIKIVPLTEFSQVLESAKKVHNL